MTGHRQLKMQVRGLLAELGTTKSEVAASLEGSGVRGIPRNLGDCAVARYLTAVLASDQRVDSLTVGRRYASIARSQSAPVHLPLRMLVRLPAPVRSFIVAFDGHEFPDLVRQTRRSEHLAT